MTAATDTRRFLVARAGNEVIIREVEPCSSVLEYTRSDAWAFAHLLGKPVESGRNKQPRATLVFEALDGSRTVIGKADDSKAAAVRTTGGGSEVTSVRTRPTHAAVYAPDAGRTTVTLTGRDDPTPNQLKFVRELLETREHSIDPVAFEQALEDNVINRATVSHMINDLKVKPRKAPTTGQPVTLDMPEVDAGYYAVMGHDDSQLRFYRVDRPTEGRWAGYTFLKVQASDEWHPIKALDTKRTILTRIANDPDAMARYGQEIGRCGRCNRTLTDEESRRIGMGPTCREL